MLTEADGEARRRELEEHLKYQKLDLPKNMQAEHRGKSNPYLETGSVFMFKAYRTALEVGDWPWHGLVGYGVMRRCITDPRVMRRLLEIGPDAMLTEGLESLARTPMDSEMATALGNERLDEISTAKGVDTMWKIPADYLRTLLGIAPGADGMGQEYTKEGTGGITEKSIKEGIYTSMFYAMLGISVHRTAILTAMWASGMMPPIMQRLTMRERIKVIAVVPETYIFQNASKATLPDIPGLQSHMYIQVSDMLIALMGSPGGKTKKRKYVDELDVEVVTTKNGVTEHMRIQGEYRVKAEGKSSGASGNDGGDGEKRTIYYVIHLLDGHKVSYGDFQGMVGVQIRNEKEEKREDPSGNATCLVDRERVAISRMVEKKYMAECPTGVPNVQELWILPWSEDDIPPRSSENRAVVPTQDEIEGFTRLIAAMGSIPIRHDMVSLMIPKTPFLSWHAKMVHGGTYPMFTQLANVALLGMMVPIRGERES